MGVGSVAVAVCAEYTVAECECRVKMMCKSDDVLISWSYTNTYADLFFIYKRLFYTYVGLFFYLYRSLL